MTGSRPRTSREAERKRRLEEALRDNLKKRKGLARERGSSDAGVSGEATEGPGAAPSAPARGEPPET